MLERNSSWNPLISPDIATSVCTPSATPARAIALRSFRARSWRTLRKNRMSIAERMSAYLARAFARGKLQRVDLAMDAHALAKLVLGVDDDQVTQPDPVAHLQGARIADARRYRTRARAAVRYDPNRSFLLRGGRD